MAYYRSYSFFKNKKALQTLNKFRKEFHSFIQAAENKNERTFSKHKQNIIVMADDIEEFLEDSGVPIIVHYGSRAAGYSPLTITQDLPRIINDQLYGLGSGDTLSEIDDLIVRSLSRYSKNVTRSVINTVNPFHWVGVILEAIILAPLRSLFQVNSNKKDIGVWHILLFIMRAIPYVAAIVAILQYFEINLKG